MRYSMERNNMKVRTLWHFRLANEKILYSLHIHKKIAMDLNQKCLETFFWCSALLLHSATLFTAICFTLSDMGSCFLLRTYCPRLNLLEVTKAFLCCIIQHWAKFYIEHFEVREAIETEKIKL